MLRHRSLLLRLGTLLLAAYAPASGSTIANTELLAKADSSHTFWRAVRALLPEFTLPGAPPISLDTRVKGRGLIIDALSPSLAVCEGCLNSGLSLLPGLWQEPAQLEAKRICAIERIVSYIRIAIGAVYVAEWIKRKLPCQAVIVGTIMCQPKLAGYLPPMPCKPQGNIIGTASK